jgi:hypothetical protein
MVGMTIAMAADGETTIN